MPENRDYIGARNLGPVNGSAARMLADDALSMVCSGQFDVTVDSYIALDHILHGLYEDADIADLANKNCAVCALGALLVSYARLVEPVMLSELDIKKAGACFALLRNKLGRAFSEEQLQLIETAFCVNSEFGPDLDEADTSFAMEFSDIDVDERFEAIMKNIIANEGVFGPYES